MFTDFRLQGLGDEHVTFLSRLCTKNRRLELRFPFCVYYSSVSVHTQLSVVL